jgi:hypothetical protein
MADHGLGVHNPMAVRLIRGNVRLIRGNAWRRVALSKCDVYKYVAI